MWVPTRSGLAPEARPPGPGSLIVVSGRVLLLAVWLLVSLPGDALARAGGGSHSFRSPSSGGSHGSGRGFGGGHHFFFFGGGGGGGGFLLLIILVVLVVLVLRARRRQRS